MLAAAPELIESAHDAMASLSAAMREGRSAAHLQLICSKLFQALQAELKAASLDEGEKKELLSSALDLCKRSADATITAQLRLDKLRAIVALLDGTANDARPLPNQPRFRVIQGGLA
jgi:hypothetical protein